MLQTESGGTDIQKCAAAPLLSFQLELDGSLEPQIRNKVILRL